MTEIRRDFIRPGSLKAPPQRVLRYLRHHTVPCPFIVLEVQPGSCVRLEIGPRGGVKLFDFPASKYDHSGREELPPDGWPDKLCAIIARLVLTR